MNPDDPQPEIPPLPVPPPRLPDEPFTGDALNALLKAPGSVVARMSGGQNLWGPAISLLLWGLVFHAIYGLAMGLFAGWSAALMDAAKAPLIALCALLLCLPSLYVFSCVAGLPITVAQSVMLGSSVVAMTGLLLIGLAPVTWLFAVSTESLGFAVMLNVLIWFLCIGFALRLVHRLSDADPRHGAVGAKWWLLIYILVSLQMATTMRPLLTPPGPEGWWSEGKKFFIAHFLESFEPQRYPGPR